MSNIQKPRIKDEEIDKIMDKVNDDAVQDLSDQDIDTLSDWVTQVWNDLEEAQDDIQILPIKPQIYNFSTLNKKDTNDDD